MLRSLVGSEMCIRDSLTLTKDDKKGIYGKSHFLNLPGFDFIENIPAEYMHSVCQGVIKRMLELTFKTGETRNRNTSRKLSDPYLFNQMMSTTKVPKEFSRRCRSLDLGVMKAQEYRNCILFFVPIIMKCIPVMYKKEIKLWLLLWFMIRSCVIPNTEFQSINVNNVNESCINFYKLFEELFGPKNCTYSVHVVTSHLLQIRGTSPLPSRSAFPFESFFGEVRSMFRPGTVSPLKQILKNCIMKRLLQTHNCSSPIVYQSYKPNTRESNEIVYIYTDKYYIYNIISPKTNQKFLCNPQGTFKYTDPLVPDLDWSSVGVFRQGPLSDEEVWVNESDIDGKILKVESFLITCPKKVLREK